MRIQQSQSDAKSCLPFYYTPTPRRNIQAHQIDVVCSCSSSSRSSGGGGCYYVRTYILYLLRMTGRYAVIYLV